MTSRPSQKTYGSGVRVDRERESSPNTRTHAIGMGANPPGSGSETSGSLSGKEKKKRRDFARGFLMVLAVGAAEVAALHTYPDNVYVRATSRLTLGLFFLQAGYLHFKVGFSES